jgi:hypothetical protein
MAETTITGLPNATTPLAGDERVPMDQNGTTVDGSTQDIANLAGAAITAAVSAHEEAADPHPGYLTPAEADNAYAEIADARFEQTLVTVRNQTGSLIAKGVAVSFAGTVGASGRLLVKPTIANGSEPGYVFLGVTAQAIVNGEDGAVLTWGKIFQVNTNAFEEGDILWVNPAVPGGFVSIEPAAPNLKLPVAAVVNKGVANGILMVRSSIGQRLQDLHDVEANGSKTNRDTLVWNQSALRWEADALTAADVGADAAGTASSAVSSHVGEEDPHTQYALEANLATVATSGAYGDLSGRPTIPTPADAAPLAPGTAAVGSSTDYAREDHVHPLPDLVTSSTAGLQPASGYGTITYAAQVTLDFAALDKQMNTISLTGDLELLTSNLANSREVRLRLVNDATERTLTFPADWKFVGTKPATIAASKVAILSLGAFGTTNADVVAAYAVQS